VQPPVYQHAVKLGKWVTHAAFTWSLTRGHLIVACGGSDCVVRLWGLDSLGSNHADGDPLIGHAEPISALAFCTVPQDYDSGVISPSSACDPSDVLASGSSDGHICVWRVSTGKCVERLVGPRDAITGIQMWMTDDFVDLASCCASGTVRIWKLAFGPVFDQPGAVRSCQLQWVMQSPGQTLDSVDLSVINCVGLSPQGVEFLHDAGNPTFVVQRTKQQVWHDAP
jgi:WD40 repeat protein